jgi:BolA family transcriptional regulator, general stress-responsive regulator
MHSQAPLATAQEVASHLARILQTDQVDVVDESSQHAGHTGNPEGLNGGTHLRVHIASPLFTGKTRVAQHRLVYDACQEFIARGLHALTIEVKHWQEPFEKQVL